MAHGDADGGGDGDAHLRRNAIGGRLRDKASHVFI